MRITTIIDDKDKRVAITPETAKKFTNLGLAVVLPSGCGELAGFSDKEYESHGAQIVKKSIIDADVYVCVKPSFAALPTLKPGSHFLGILSPWQNEETLKKLFNAGAHLYALEKIPRITRAQSMDILSSQANIAGYRAVIDAISFYGKVVPMMMTAAGTVRPAKVLILGAGVAGLQAIATAKRLGAIVSAFDVRSVAKEQVESLGATFVEVESDDSGETSAGYAKEMNEDYKKRQAKKLEQVMAEVDIVISTAQIPNKPAPRLITKAMVKSMRAGSIIVDMATETGGNCELSEQNNVIAVNDVTIIGYTDFASRVAHDASQLFARNAFNFVSLMIKDGKIDLSDEIVHSTIINY